MFSIGGIDPSLSPGSPLAAELGTIHGEAEPGADRNNDRHTGNGSFLHPIKTDEDQTCRHGSPR